MVDCLVVVVVVVVVVVLFSSMVHLARWQVYKLVGWLMLSLE